MRELRPQSLMTLRGAQRGLLLEPFLEVWKSALVWRAEKRQWFFPTVGFTGGW